MSKKILRLFGFGWSTVKYDKSGVFAREKNKYTGEERIVVPAHQIRRLRPDMRPEF